MSAIPTTHQPSRDAPAFTRRFVAPRPPLRLSRRQVGMLVWVSLGAAGVVVVIPQLGELQASLATLSGVEPVWVAAGLALVATRYAMAVISLQAAVDRPIPFGPTLLVQLASSFIGRLTPEGLGWLVLNQRYLERAGLPRSAGIAAIAMKVLAGGLSRVIIALAVVAAIGGGDVPGLQLTRAWPAAFAIVLALAVAGSLAVRVTRSRAPRAMESLQSGARALHAVLTRPSRAAVLFGSAASLTLLPALALAASVRAVGVEADLASVFAVYLGGSAIASVSPTPGNLGAVEAALTAGLTAIGVPIGPAIAAVLVYRLITFWLPVVPGFLAFRALQTRNLL